MSRYSKGYDLVLYGPDTRHGAKRKKGFKKYVWYIRCYDRGRKRERSTGTGDFEKAQKFVAEEWLPNRTTKPDSPLPSSEMDITKALTLYGESHGPNASDPKRIGYAIDALLLFWGNNVCSDINELSCKNYVKFRINDGRASDTARRELGCLQAALNFGVRAGFLKEAPIVTLPPKSDPKDRWLTRAEAAALLRASRNRKKAKHTLPLFILFGLYTAARTQAILTLQWKENGDGGWVDLDNALIYWNPKSGRITNKRRAKCIPVAGRLLRFLKYQRSRTRKYVFEHDCIPIRDNKRAFNMSKDEAWLEKDQYGNPIKGTLKDVTRHTLKHTSIKWMLQKGISIYDVAKYSGTSSETVERVYGHHSPDHMKQILKAFE